MKTEVFEVGQADDFMAAVTGKRVKKAGQKPPRAPRGEGDRLAALAKLAKAGWVSYQCQAGQHWLAHSDGRTSPLCASYGAAIDAALELI